MGTLSPLISILVVCVFVETVSALNCYQCNSTLDHNCQEFFNHDNPYSGLVSTPCRMYKAKFCIKATGLWAGIVGTHRFCSARDLGDQCQDMRFPDHSRKYRGCIYTCTSDDCNAASTLFTSSVVVTSILSLLSALLLR